MRKKANPKKKLVKKESNLIWVIAYINRDFLNVVELELKRYGYDIEAYIPTVRVLKKQFKGKNVFEFVPLYFNYGFFRVEYEDACNPEFLLELRSRIGAIYGWVKDPLNNIKKNASLRDNNQESYKALPGSAFATDNEVALMAKNTENLNVYSSEELKRFKKGDYIKLKGYPFDDMPAEIKKINYHKKEILVELQMDDVMTKEVTVSFENVFYTVYQGYDESLSNDVNFDELESHHKNSLKTDSLMYKSHYHGDEE
jgi:transcription antitermination factor NusG